MSASSLAVLLVNIFHKFTIGIVAPIEVNSLLCFSIQTDLKQLAGQGLNDKNTIITLRPYHALLLLYDPEEIVFNMPIDSSSLLIELIQVVTPTQWYMALFIIVLRNSKQSLIVH
jgi:hypothetical protein